MAFPQVATAQYSEEATVTTTHDAALPSGVAEGDLLLLFISLDGASSPSITGGLGSWNLVTSASISAQIYGFVYYKFAGAGEGDVQYTVDNAEQSGNYIVRVTGAHASTAPEGTSNTTGSPSANPDPPSYSLVGWSGEDTLWIAFEAHDQNGTASVYPTGYDDNQFTQAVTAADNGLSFSTKEDTTDTDNPAAYTITASNDWTAFTVAVRPAAAVSGVELGVEFNYSPMRMPGGVVAS